jgi:hypothetical protein
LKNKRAKFFQKINRRFVERRTKSFQTQFPRMIEDRSVPFPRRVCLLVEFVERRVFPKAIGVADEKVAVLYIKRDSIGGVGLELDGVCAGFRGSFDNFESAVE